MQAGNDFTWSRFTKALQRIDALNSEDPNRENGQPSALLYSKRMSRTLLEFCPEADELLRLAARGQHLRRWNIPRSSYDMDRKGYLLWRLELKQMHARLMREIMVEQGYLPGECDAVANIILKKTLKKNLTAQILEDVVCLVFMQYYFDAFLNKYKSEPGKVVSIIRKTWEKMSAKGQQAALKLEFSDLAARFVNKALH